MRKRLVILSMAKPKEFGKRMSCLCGRGSSGGIDTRYGTDGPGIESRWERDFSAPVQTGPFAHPVACTPGTGSFFSPGDTAAVA
jgi:hypothetical protein